MAAVFPIVREHMEKAQREQQATYNWPIQPREFQTGDKVLVLIPTAESKFLATWQGPFEVAERIGEVNYRVNQPGKRKLKQIYHINLLKKWHARDALFGGCLTTEKVSGSREDVQVSADLTPQQQQETLELVEQNIDVFSFEPGHTHVMQHEIHTIPGKVIHQRPYKIPEARREAIKEEVRKM